MTNFKNVRIAVVHREGDKDWAGTGRYLSIRAHKSSSSDALFMGPDIPITSDYTEAQIEQLAAMLLAAVCGRDEHAGRAVAA